MEGTGTGGSPAPAGRAGPSLHWEEGARRPPFLQASTPPPGGGLGSDQPRSLRLLPTTAGSGCAPNIPRKCEAEFSSGGGEEGAEKQQGSQEGAGKLRLRSFVPRTPPPPTENPSLPEREGSRGDLGSRLQRRFCSETTISEKRGWEVPRQGSQLLGRKPTVEGKGSPLWELKLGGPSYHVTLPFFFSQRLLQADRAWGAEVPSKVT